MSLRARIRHFARPAAFTAALTALLVPAVAGPATADAAKRTKRYPVVTSVRPMNPKVGDTIVIRGRNFNRGKNKNTVVFKRDGARAVFVKTTLATAKQIRVVVPDTLRPFLPDNTSARFRLRILAQRFSKSFTKNAASPTVTALPKPAGSTGGSTTGGTTTGGGGTTSDVPAAVKECHGDEDGDLLPADLENSLGLDACKADTDGDGVPDGYEYQSAMDLNDDEYQDPNQFLPYPGKRPYPNALENDANADHDGDSLTLLEEYRLWRAYGNTTTLNNLEYSAGELYSMSYRDATGRRRPKPEAKADTYAKHLAFAKWADVVDPPDPSVGHEGDPTAGHYDPVMLPTSFPWHDAANQTAFRLQDFNRLGGVQNRAALPRIDWDTTVGDPPLVLGYSRSEDTYYDLDGDGWISDDERDEDMDGLTNFDEAHGRMTSGYWEGCYTIEVPYPIVYANLDLTLADSDGDGIRDGADDQDHDDIPNIMELSRNAASGYVDWDRYKGPCNVRQSLLKPDGADAGSDPDTPVTVHPDDFGRVNPFNPCLPYTWSRTCERHPGLTDAFAPFDGSTQWLALQ